MGLTTKENYYNINILRSYEAYLVGQLGWTKAQINDLYSACETDFASLEHEDTWFNQELADRFHQEVVSRTGDVDIAYKVGAYAVDDRARGVAGRFLVGLLSPRFVYSRIGFIANMYTRSSRFLLKSSSRTKATIEVHIAPGCDEKAYQCRNKIGMLESIPTSFDLPKASVSHPKCFHRGDECCVYEVEWVEPSHTYKYAISFIVFIGSFLWLMNYFSSAYALMMALGITGGVFSLFNIRSEHLIRRALNDQINALKISIENTFRKQKEMTLINEITELVNHMISAERLCPAAADAIREKMGYDRVIVFTVDDAKETFQVRGFAGFDDAESKLLDNLRFRLHTTGGLFTDVVVNKKPLLIKDIDQYAPHFSRRSQELIKALFVSSFIAVPIEFGDDVYGIITVDNCYKRTPLLKNDKALLHDIAKQIGLAFSNASQFEKLIAANELLENKVRERTAELAEARDHAIQANKAKTKFFHNVTHELRSPLNAIVNYTDMIKEDLNDEGRTEFNDDFGKIDYGCKLLLSHINTLLDHGKLESGQMTTYFEEVEINQALKEVSAVVSTLAIKNGNKLLVTENEEKLYMETDKTKLIQILINLGSNACKFTKGGNVSIQYEMINKNDKESLRFVVKDTGIGIPQDKQSVIFEEFSQADESTSSNYGGTGLGLPICKQFTEMMGGEISVSSKEGEGSSFIVILPRYQTEKADYLLEAVEHV